MRAVKAGKLRPILSLDFDGVLHGYDSGWKGARNIPDPPVPGAIAFLLAAVEHFGTFPEMRDLLNFKPWNRKP